MKYRADIGGLRALAIVSVVLFHFKVPGFLVVFLESIFSLLYLAI
jgi:peptidoglycan/LPS O-acetylase OafA/YrhL